MTTKRKIEVFSAGCSVCNNAIELVKHTSCSSCEVTVLDMQDTEVAKRAKQLGIAKVPAIVVDGKLAGCYADTGITEDELRKTGIGTPPAN